jgi:predicted ArsR family transcriptional regulator
MTINTKPTASTAPAGPVTKSPNKSTLVLKLLSRAKGAALAEIAEPTGWQPHSARAHLSNLRKQGRSVVREQRKTGETAYRIVQAATQAASTCSVTSTL